jgi:hypothetical protein
MHRRRLDRQSEPQTPFDDLLKSKKERDRRIGKLAPIGPSNG